MKFKVNDKVRNKGTVRPLYIVDAANEDEIKVKGYGGWFKAFAFELIEEAKPPLKCIEHVPAREAHTKIIPGELFHHYRPSGEDDHVMVAAVRAESIVLNVGNSYAGTWTKLGLLDFSRVLAELAGYMED